MADSVVVKTEVEIKSEKRSVAKSISFSRENYMKLLRLAERDGRTVSNLINNIIRRMK